jgi:glycyl-tRNA synthetase beta chain
MSEDLLFEIGCEELPATFVHAALEALPGLAQKKLAELRLSHGAVRTLGTPRRLALIVEGLAARQPDLEEEVTGPPVSAAYKDGKPTKAAEAFAQKLGIAVDALERVSTPKGEYLRGVRREKGRAAGELLPDALATLATSIPFKKSMRWGSGSLAWGRPIRWLLALVGTEPLTVRLEGIESGAVSYGHRFLHPTHVAIPSAGAYTNALRQAHVIVDPAERRRIMRERLVAAASAAGGTLIEDEFLYDENLSLVEDPRIVTGSFDAEFLDLPEAVILEVARGHQRYFGVRGADGKLLPKYLAVVNTAERPDKIAQGNDRVMRARLADARFFWRTDLERDLASRREELRGIVFHNRLGSVFDKVARMEKLAADLAVLLGAEADRATALEAAALAKCDLVTLMVRELPELQGDMGRAYALRQKRTPVVADAVRDHYKPKGAAGEPPATTAAALVGLADRFDTLVGCFAVGIQPTSTADPFALRRAAIGILRIAFDRQLDLSVGAAAGAAFDAYAGVKLDLEKAAVQAAVADFFRDRLRGLLLQSFPPDVSDAALGVAADRPLDARARARAILELDPGTRTKVGEIFKRATNIAKEAPAGTATDIDPESHELFFHFNELKQRIDGLLGDEDYPAAFGALALLAPVLHQYFETVFVMVDDLPLRENRLRLLREIAETCRRLAHLELLGGV